MKYQHIIAGLAWLCMAVAAAGVSAEEKAGSGSMRIFIGTYTRGESKGIYTSVLNLKTGELSAPQLAAETVNPSFLALNPKGDRLYSVSEVAAFDGKKTGGVAAFTVDAAAGKLTLINTQPSGGKGPCHVQVDATGKAVLVANYGEGSIASLPINGKGGLDEAVSVIQHEGSSINPSRQKGPHAHCINLDPANKFAAVADLGLDKVLVYAFDPATGKLKAAEKPFATVKPGGGPRHVAFTGDAKFIYVLNEIASTITAFTYDAESGGMSELKTYSTLPEKFDGRNSTAEIFVHPSGKYLYASNRGHNSIAAYAIDTKTGDLTSLGNTPTGGEVPRNFNIDPTGKFLLAANQQSHDIFVFRINKKNGKLKPTGAKIEVPSPVCIEFLPLKP